MKATELREIDADGLRAKAAEIEDELFRLRIRKAMGQLEKPVRMEFLIEPVGLHKVEGKPFLNAQISAKIDEILGESSRMR